MMIVNGQKEPTLVENIVQFYSRNEKPNYLVQVFRLTKRFGSTVALDHINIDFEKGKIHGIIGPKGAGKTVLLKSISGLLVPDLGGVRVAGQLIGIDCIRPNSIGACIGNVYFVPYKSGKANMLSLCNRKKTYLPNIDISLKHVGLDPELRLPVIMYSRSMRKKLEIAYALLTDPDMLVLDEPMADLDSHSVKEIIGLLLEKRNEGKTIIITSCLSQDIHEICDTLHELKMGAITKVR